MCVVYEDPIAYCADQGAELIDGSVCVKPVHEPVRLRTTLTLECLGRQCFEKIRAEMARKNLLPEFADSAKSNYQETPAFDEPEDFDDVEIITQRQERRRGRRCGECPPHLETLEDL
ncbi:MAG: uncharacterized protein KVP18_002582 [Porospora cf. gigantea A]|uniref:uncharacterized protein n=1 Tax=Porospora cf. gigantea A TaxID=2853593 RepID=UPI003559FA9E|nr:MAG: hypothetical protein KVP18_002582 [Porospora cf. gigantea A]